MKSYSFSSSFAILFTLLLASGCGDSDSHADGDAGGSGAEPGTASLTIVGDANVFLDAGSAHQLSVRYHSGDGGPLAGEVSFELVGAAGGATLGAASAVTGADGVATVQLAAGDMQEAAFRVRASAAEAAEVEWTVAVTVPVPLSVVGTYEVASELDLVSGIPGAAGDVINGFLEMTDDPYDPATWLLDVTQSQINNRAIEQLLRAARPALDAILNEVLLSVAPDAIAHLVALGDDLGQVARRFGTDSALTIAAVDDGLTASHAITGAHFELDGVMHRYAASELGMGEVSSEGIGCMLEEEARVHLDDHSLSLSYGALLLAALEDVIIPRIDDRASDLPSLLASLINCQQVGQAIADQLGIGSPRLYAGACTLALDAAAATVHERIASLDAAGIELAIAGKAEVLDDDGDRQVDVLRRGSWEGQVRVAGQGAPLEGATFHGDRRQP